MATIKDQIRVALNRDGDDHVNIDPYGATQVGKVCFPEWRRKFYIPHFGDFVSPRAFANWAVTGGNEQYRHDTSHVELRVPDVIEFRTLMLYAKFYQMSALRKSFLGERKTLKLPWMMYKKHLSGVKEHNRWETYPEIVKAFATHHFNFGQGTKFDFDAVVPGLTETVNHYIRGIVGPEFVGIENLDQLSEAMKKEREAEEEARRLANEHPEPGALDNDEAQPIEGAHECTIADGMSERQRQERPAPLVGLPADEEEKKDVLVPEASADETQTPEPQTV